MLKVRSLPGKRTASDHLRLTRHKNLFFFRPSLGPLKPFCATGMRERRITVMFETDLTDQELLEQVVLFYRQRFQDYAPAQEYLVSRGLTAPELLETFELGFADR